MPVFGPPVDLTALRPRRVCIIKPSALGDVANAFAAVAALRALWPKAHLSWVINSSLRGLVDGHPAIDEVLPFDRARSGFRPAGLATFLGFLGDLRKRHFDLAIDLQGLLRSGIMAAATGARARVGLADAREGASWFYTHWVSPRPEEVHAVDRLLAVARAFGADVSDPKPEAALSEGDRAWAKAVLADVPRPRLAINLGARWETKRWPPAHFAEVARRAERSFGAGLFAIGAAEDRPFVAEVAERLQDLRLLDLCGATTLPRLAALAAEADLVLSNDTGPLHLAVAAGARVVGVYTCTSPALNGPYGPRSLAIQTDVWCKGSYRVSCPRLECMSELTPDRVWPLVRAQLEAATGVPLHARQRTVQ